MLKDKLYKINSSKRSESQFDYVIQINPEHSIYAGHFPGFPVTPGVVELEIVKELVEGEIGRKVRLSTIKNSKFTQILDPTKVGDLSVSVILSQEESTINVEAEIKDSADKYLVLRSSYLVLGD